MMGHMVSKMYESAMFDPLSPQSRSPFFSIYFLIYLELHTHLFAVILPPQIKGIVLTGATFNVQLQV